MAVSPESQSRKASSPILSSMASGLSRPPNSAASGFPPNKLATEPSGHLKHASDRTNGLGSPGCLPLAAPNPAVASSSKSGRVAELYQNLSTQMTSNENIADYALFFVRSNGQVAACASPGMQHLDGTKSLFENLRTNFQQSAGMKASSPQKSVPSPRQGNNGDDAYRGPGASSSSCRDVSKSFTNLPATPKWPESQTRPSNRRRRRRSPQDDVHEEHATDTDAHEAENYNATPGKMCVDITSEEEVTKYMMLAVEVIQENVLKDILKKFIKAIEPRKQSKYPYQSSETRIRKGRDPRERYPRPLVPPWWPPLVRHREPDHTKKDERFLLLKHLLSDWPLKMAKRQLERSESGSVAIQLSEEEKDFCESWQRQSSSNWYTMLETSLRECTFKTGNDSDLRVQRRREVMRALLVVTRAAYECFLGDIDAVPLYVDTPVQIPALRPKKKRERVPDFQSGSGDGSYGISDTTKCRRSRQYLQQNTIMQTSERGGATIIRQPLLADFPRTQPSPKECSDQVGQSVHTARPKLIVRKRPQTSRLGHGQSDEAADQPQLSWSGSAGYLRATSVPKAPNENYLGEHAVIGNNLMAPIPGLKVEHHAMQRLATSQQPNAELFDGHFDLYDGRPGSSFPAPQVTATEGYMLPRPTRPEMYHNIPTPPIELVNKHNKRTYSPISGGYSKPSKRPQFRPRPPMTGTIDMDHQSFFNPDLYYPWDPMTDAKPSLSSNMPGESDFSPSQLDGSAKLTHLKGHSYIGRENAETELPCTSANISTIFPFGPPTSHAHTTLRTPHLFSSQGTGTTYVSSSTVPNSFYGVTDIP